VGGGQRVLWAAIKTKIGSVIAGEINKKEGGSNEAKRT